MAQENTPSIPTRAEIPVEHTWDLGKLFTDDAAWDAGLEELAKQTEGIGEFQGTLHESGERLRACFDYMNEVELLDGFLDISMGVHVEVVAAEPFGVPGRHRSIGGHR